MGVSQVENETPWILFERNNLLVMHIYLYTYKREHKNSCNIALKNSAVNILNYIPFSW